MVATSKYGWPLHPDPKTNLLVTFLPCPPKSQHLPPRYLIRAPCAPFFPPVPDAMTWWARREEEEGEGEDAGEGEGEGGHTYGDGDDGGRLTFSQIYKFLTMDTKRETTTVLARNNGSGACRG